LIISGSLTPPEVCKKKDNTTMPWSVFNTINWLRYKINPIERGGIAMESRSGKWSAAEGRAKPADTERRKIITMAA